MGWLLGLAIVLQSADAAVTCRRLAQGGWERNPLLPCSCGRIVLIKTALTVPMFALTGTSQRIWAGAMAVSGGVGLTLTFTLGKR